MAPCAAVQEHSKWLGRFARGVQMCTDVVFSMGYVIFFDYIVFALNCDWQHFSKPMHRYWTDVSEYLLPPCMCSRQQFTCCTCVNVVSANTHCMFGDGSVFDRQGQ